MDTNEPRESEKHDAASIGVGFDGRYYRYREFRYERCSDAVGYAKLDRDKPQYSSKVIKAVPWEEPYTPTEEEQLEMTELGISFDGKNYRYEGYNYERFVDAANYAHLRNSKGFQSS